MQRTKFLGISMERRSRRRALVTGTYLFLAALMSLVLVRQAGRLLQPGDFIGGANLVFILVFTVVSRWVFGSLVRMETVPVPQPGEFAPDERELVVRNRAHFYVFRCIAVYLTLLWMAYAVLNANGIATISLNVFGLLIFPAVIMAITLPQALILWTEPDLPAGDPDHEFASVTSR